MTDAVHQGATELIPAWEDLRSDYIDAGVPGLFVVRRNPRVALFVDQGGARFGALVELTGETPLPSSLLSEISVKQVQMDGARHLEIATSSGNLYRDFYLLLGELIVAIVMRGAQPTTALVQALDRWSALLSTRTILSEERQIGLFGELWMLTRLLPQLGSATLDAWVGPTGTVHDFRFGQAEFEVKTTSSARRTHTINGLAQLTPSENCRLYLLSLHMTAGGASGQTLADSVAILNELVSGFQDGPTRFSQLLESCGFRAADAPHYPTRRRIGGPVRLIPVEAGCPRLTRSALSSLTIDCVTERILEVRYDIEVEGLGYVDGDPQFLAILPAQRSHKDP